MAKGKQPIRPRKKTRGISSISTWRKFASHRFWYLFLAGLFGLGMVAYFGSGSPGRNGGDRSGSSDVIMTVNGINITRAQFDRYSELARKNGGASDDLATARMQGEVLQGLAKQAMLISVAKRRGLKVTDAEIDKEIDAMRQKFGTKKEPASDDDLLKLQNVDSMDTLKASIKNDLLVKKLQDTFLNAQHVTDEDVQQTFDEAKVRHILIATSGGDRFIPGALPDAQAKHKAEEILAKIKDGGDFAKLANEYTMDPGNKMDPKTGKPLKTPNGGLYDWKKLSDYVPEFANAVRKLQPGQVSDLVKTAYGYHIIRLEDKIRRNLPADYAKQKDQLLKDLQAKRAQKPYSDMVDSEFKAAKIVWKDDSMKWRYDYAKLPDYSDPMSFSMPNPDSAKDQVALVTELKAFVKKDKTDSPAALLLAKLTYEDYVKGGIPDPITKKAVDPNDPKRAAQRKELIDLFEQGLAHAEDSGFESRFTLVDLYNDAGEKDKAHSMLLSIQKKLKWAMEPSDQNAHQRLFGMLNRFGDTVNADVELKAIAEIAAKAQKERQSGQSSAPGGSFTIPPGGQMTVPAGAPKKVGKTVKDKTNSSKDADKSTDKESAAKNDKPESSNDKKSNKSTDKNN